MPCCPDYQVALAHQQPSYKTPIQVSPGLSPQQLRLGGGVAILKLQLGHIPETEKLEPFSNLSCFLQRMSILLLWEGRLAVEGGCFLQQIKAEPLPL